MQPVFSYEVRVDVTDNAGETHSGTSLVLAGYSSVLLSATVPESFDVHAKAAVAINSTNMNHAPVSIRGSVSVEKLRVPDRVYRQRILPWPDRFAMSREEFIRAFPNDVWKDEHIEDTWPVEKIAIRQDFWTNAAGQDTVQLAQLEPGRYRVIVSAKDPSGDTLLLKYFFTAYSDDTNAPATMEGSMLYPFMQTCEPGDTARVLFGTSFSDARPVSGRTHARHYGRALVALEQ
ncbi:MAG: hypothetical protein IPP94_19850 [Ignavibacteria bacterium]|nr:hypothetical protein [Ignavibacteria bacterium]